MEESNNRRRDSSSPLPTAVLRLYAFAKSTIREFVDLSVGTDVEGTIESVKREIYFKNEKLWILVFAIFLASIGLNVNSTAVIIGAMLVSPLMGPIIGIGLSVGINDFDTLKRSLKNLGAAVFFSVLTSTLYFSISPLSDAQSELLARTTPTIYDVLIAFFGGAAGIVAGSRREKTNVIPGVAIATALMPPLCTAGYGLASGNAQYFFGAFYLFFINSVFISLSTYVFVRLQKFPKVHFVNPDVERRVKMYITTFSLLTVIPSVWLGYKVVQESFFRGRVQSYINTEFVFDRTQVLSSKATFAGDSSKVEITLYGDPVEEGKLAELRKKAVAYGLSATSVHVYQSTDATRDLATASQSLRVGIIEDLYKKNEEMMRDKDQKIALLERELSLYTGGDNSPLQIVEELRVQNPELVRVAIAPRATVRRDTVEQHPLIVAEWKVRPSERQKQTMEQWARVRLRDSTAEVMHTVR